MPWSTPKTNWQSADVVLPADFNRIEGNTSYLKNVLDGVEVQNITFPGTFTVGGAVTLQNIANIVGNVWMQSNLDVRGTLTVGGAVTLQNIANIAGNVCNRHRISSCSMQAGTSIFGIATEAFRS